MKTKSRIDWDDPAAANVQFRELWDHVELDPATYESVLAAWTVGNEPVSEEETAHQVAPDNELYEEHESPRWRKSAYGIPRANTSPVASSRTM